MREGFLKKINHFSKKAFTTITNKVLAENMGHVMKYIIHRALPNSIILGSSNPILSTNKTILDSISAAVYHDIDVYSGIHEPHQQLGNINRYYSSRSDRGIAVLRKALFEYCESKNFDIKNIDFFVTNSILSTILPAFLDKALRTGDTVLLTKPTYGPFFSNLYRRGMDVKLTNLTNETNWKITPEILQKMLDEAPNARMFTLINPGNPLGEFYSKNELQALSKVFIKFNQGKSDDEKLIVFSDEVGRNLILSDQEFVSIGSLPGMGDFTYTGWSLSKDVGGPGIATAIGIGPKWLVEKVRIDDAGPAYAIQYGAAKAFELSNQPVILEHCNHSKELYKQNIKLLAGRLEELNYNLSNKLQLGSHYNLISPLVFPEGGFQLPLHASGVLGMEFPDDYIHTPDPSVRYIRSSLDFAWYLRERYGVELIPGEGYGFHGQQMVFRMATGKRVVVLHKAMDKISDAVNSLRSDEHLMGLSNKDRSKPLSRTDSTASTEFGTTFGPKPVVSRSKVDSDLFLLDNPHLIKDPSNSIDKANSVTPLTKENSLKLG